MDRCAMPGGWCFVGNLEGELARQADMRVLGGGIDERLPRLQKEGRWLSSELSAFLPPPGSNKHKVCELLLWLYFLGLEEELVAKKEDSKGKGDVSCGTPTLSKQQVLSSQKTWPNMAAKWENCLFRSNLPKSTAVLIQPLTNLEERSLKNWHLMTIRWKPRSSSSGKMSLALGVLIMMDSCQRMKCMMCSQISKSVLQALRTSKVRGTLPRCAEKVWMSWTLSVLRINAQCQSAQTPVAAHRMAFWKLGKMFVSK